MSRQPFRQLSDQEYLSLTLEERMDYLRRLMGELREKLEDTRRQAERMKASDEEDS